MYKNSDELAYYFQGNVGTIKFYKKGTQKTRFKIRCVNKYGYSYHTISLISVENNFSNFFTCQQVCGFDYHYQVHYKNGFGKVVLRSTYWLLVWRLPTFPNSMIVTTNNNEVRCLFFVPLCVTFHLLLLF